LAYDATLTKVQKARRDDFRVEEEMRTNKAKYDESCEDVHRRMLDIKDAEVDSVRDLTSFLDTELDFHERCAEELRRVRQDWAAGGSPTRSADRRPAGRTRSNTSRSNDRLSRSNSHEVYYENDEDEPPPPPRMPVRVASRPALRGAEPAGRPSVARAHTFQGRPTQERAKVPSLSTPSHGHHVANAGALRAGLRPINRSQTNYGQGDVFGDDGDDTASSTGSPDWGERSTSPATSFGSLNRSTSNVATRKAPPPPPPSRSKKPPPPIPAKRPAGY